MADVEVRRRLVEEENSRLLRERARDHDPLPLATRELVHTPAREAEDAGLGHHALGNRDVPRAFERKRRMMRGPAHQHHLGDGVGKRHRRVLGHDRDEAGEDAARAVRERCGRRPVDRQFRSFLGLQHGIELWPGVACD